MFRTYQNLFRSAALLGWMAVAMPSLALAQAAGPASTGLGQAWPPATDFSMSPQWHVYVFALNGTKYIQINDLNGTVYAAVGLSSSHTFVLPIGIDVQGVITSTTANSDPDAQMIYSDGGTTVTVAPGDGHATLTVTTTCQDPFNCGGGGSQ